MATAVSGPPGAKSDNSAMNVDEQLAILEEGRLIPPRDELTKDGLSLWEGNEPLYHDLEHLTYTKFDVSEWAGRVRKQKADVVRQSRRCVELEGEIARLRDEFNRTAVDYEEYEVRRAKAEEEGRRLADELHNLTSKKNVDAAEVMQLRRSKAEIEKRRAGVVRDMGEMGVRTQALRNEVAHNRARHEAALGEKEKLNLERRWFFYERLLLEETTAQELQDISVMRQRLAQLRQSLQSAWRDTKQADVLGHLRAARVTPNDRQWFDARRRLAPPPGSSAAGTDEGSGSARSVAAS